MFPQDDRISYSCPDKPLHLGAYVSSLGYSFMHACGRLLCQYVRLVLVYILYTTVIISTLSFLSLFMVTSNSAQDRIRLEKEAMKNSSLLLSDDQLFKDTPKYDTTERINATWDNDSDKQCPYPSPLLKGRMTQPVLLIPRLKELDVMSLHKDLGPGGQWKPENCCARSKVAIILPYRDRQNHLTRLLDYIIPMLKRQLLDFRFIVTEQYGKELFNKGRIMNAGFTLAEKLGVDCVIFQDVDMFPQDDRIPYSCPDKPLHLGAYVSSLGYSLWYNNLVGGVLSMRCDHYKQVNGYSNSYWGWGGEDDDMGKRILANKLLITRPPLPYSKYSMLKHPKRNGDLNLKHIYALLGKTAEAWRFDGLAQKQWKILKISLTPLYYHISVDVGKPPEEWKVNR